MNTEQKLQRIRQLCDDLSSSTKPQIQRLCAEIENATDRPSSFGGDDIRWRELIGRVVRFTKGLHDHSYAQNALTLLGTPP